MEDYNEYKQNLEKLDFKGFEYEEKKEIKKEPDYEAIKEELDKILIQLEKDYVKGWEIVKTEDMFKKLNKLRGMF